ncbi:hypothetical protein ACOSQ2_002995 [Xanthoceras sorbifolium]
MARIFLLSTALDGTQFLSSFFGGFLLVFQLLMVVSIMSMIMFACVEGPPNKNEEDKKPKVQIDPAGAGEAAGHAVGCCCKGGGNGDGDGDGDGGGCGGCGGD